MLIENVKEGKWSATNCDVTVDVNARDLGGAITMLDSSGYEVTVLLASVPDFMRSMKRISRAFDERYKTPRP